MQYVAILAFILILAGCGPNKELAAEKFDSPLKERIASLSAPVAADSAGDTMEARVEELLIVGTCDTTINGAMRKDLLNNGAESIIMKGKEFTARVSSDDIYDIGALEFVRRLGLQRRK